MAARRGATTWLGNVPLPSLSLRVSAGSLIMSSIFGPADTPASETADRVMISRAARNARASASFLLIKNCPSADHEARRQCGASRHRRASSHDASATYLFAVHRLVQCYGPGGCRDVGASYAYSLAVPAAAGIWPEVLARSTNGADRGPRRNFWIPWAAGTLPPYRGMRKQDPERLIARGLPGSSRPCWGDGAWVSPPRSGVSFPLWALEHAPAEKSCMRTQKNFGINLTSHCEINRRSRKMLMSDRMRITLIRPQPPVAAGNAPR